MRVRRCAMLMLEPREQLQFDLGKLAAGGSGLHRVIQWIAFAPHLDIELVLNLEEVAAIGATSPTNWMDRDDLAKSHTSVVVDSLIKSGLLITEGGEAANFDQKLRDTHWRSASALTHYASRWRGVDTESVQSDFAETIGGQLVDWLGPPPSMILEHAKPEQRIRLVKDFLATPLDNLLGKRVTCRNFDSSRLLPQEQFSSILFRVFGARAVDEYAPGVQLLKKGTPSAGGLHPTEAYLLVNHVEGIEQGLYHYHPVDHALEPIRMLDAQTAAVLAKRFVAAQSYFVDAHVMVIPTSRFGRNFWKYRNHSKAYRALILDVGHLSQTLYLAATELGLAAFVTAAVNEVDIEQEFGMDPLEEGPIAVGGFGYRGAECVEAEFDPLHAVWPAQ